MGLVLPQEIIIYNTHDTIDKYYKGLGYDELIDESKKNNKKYFKINASDLSDGSGKYVYVQCDICKDIHIMRYAKYTKNINRNKGYYVCDDIKAHDEMYLKESIEYIKNSILQYSIKHGEFPSGLGFNKYNDMPNKILCERILRRIDKTLPQFINELNPDNKVFKLELYIEYLNKFKTLVGIGELKPTKQDLRHNNHELPTMEWFIENCPNKNIKTKEDFLEYAEIENVYITKEETIRRIYKMAENLERPLMYDDFRGDIKENSINLTYVRNYWGTLNKMKEDLGLEIIQESMMDKNISIDSVTSSIKQVCEIVFKTENRKDISTKDFAKYSDISIASIRKYLNEYLNTTMGEYLNNIGYNLLKSGTGMNYTFLDGEKTSSTYEYDFSCFLKDLGYRYNIDYHRDVRYKTFIDNYNGLLNCDYVFNLNNNKIYVEIVGLIDRYKNNYYNDIPITNSKSKEKYRNKLKLKEKMFQDKNLNYHIVFPEDLEEFKIKLKEVLKGDKRNC